jgi:hypothetical protein
MPSNELQDFEARIAYFYGVNDAQPVILAYLNALEQLSEADSKAAIEQNMMPYLIDAYRSISSQNRWDFDILAAAQAEFQVIWANRVGASFEQVQGLMEKLYAVVFQSNSPLIVKAAMLRTFLYKYKADVIKNNGTLSEEDQSLLLDLAEASGNYLNAIKCN